jgi:hypothetical protein
MKVITRAIDDVALYEVMRAQDKELTEEEKEFESSANAFLFNEEHRIPLDDYKVDVICPKCENIWESIMSLAAGADSICPACNYKTSWKFTTYTVTNDQIIKDISLKELISLWGVDDIKGFRAGCKRRIGEIVSSKLKSIEGKKMKKKNQMELPHMPDPDPSLAKPKTKKKANKELQQLRTVIQQEREKAEAEVESSLEKTKYVDTEEWAIRARTIQSYIDIFSYFESMIDKLL